ncbi:MAG: toxin-antitoxin system HicB family antitoxin [Chloroflexota bacterium]
MGRFTLRIPKTLHTELEVLAKGEGISLNQYIIYTLTQKVTAEKLAIEGQGLTSEQVKFLANVKLVSPERVAEQRTAFEALLTRLGPAASDEEVERFLSERETVEPEAELEVEAVNRLKERIAQVRQPA